MDPVLISIDCARLVADCQRAMHANDMIAAKAAADALVAKAAELQSALSQPPPSL